MNEDQYTNKAFMLPVGHGHKLRVHDWGKKSAKTVFFFLHGGPGGSCKDRHKIPFDPKTQRVIFHDQRGSGKSLPVGKWQHNNTQELAADITAIANHLGVKKFVVVGNSWGSTLALYYAILNPERVSAVVVSGIWFGSKAENAWIDNGDWKMHFPDVWERFCQSVPKEFQTNPAKYCFNTAFSDDKIAAAEAIRLYGDLEASLVSLDDRHQPTPAVDYDPSGMFIEMHYMARGCFMPNRFIPNNADKLTMPVHIVQGRYDFVCPPAAAYELHKQVPKSTLTWVTAGHAGEHETVTAISLIYRQLTK